MEHSERPVLVVAQVVIAHLRQSVQALMDEDRVLPTDGWSLLSTLDQARNDLNSENTSAAGNAIGCFADRVQALTEAGVLETGEGRQQIEVAAAAMRDLLSSADVAVSGRKRDVSAVARERGADE